MSVPVYHGNDRRLSLTGLRDADGNYLNSATVTYEIFTAAGVTTGVSGSLSYVSASSGNYAATVESSTIDTLTAGGLYRVEVVAVSGGSDGEFNEVWRVEAHRGTR